MRSVKALLLAVVLALAGLAFAASASASVTPQSTGGGCKNLSNATICISSTSSGRVVAKVTWKGAYSYKCESVLRIYKGGKKVLGISEGFCIKDYQELNTDPGQHGTFFAEAQRYPQCPSACTSPGAIRSPNISG